MSKDIVIEKFRKKNNKNHKGIFDIKHKTYNRVSKNIEERLRVFTGRSSDGRAAD